MGARRFAGFSRPAALRPAGSTTADRASARPGQPRLRSAPARLLSVRSPVGARLAVAPFLAVIVTCVCALSAATPAFAAAECPNEQFRTGHAAALPDCRAYEVVSPADSQPFFETLGLVQNIVPEPVEIIGEEKGVFAAASGDRLAYFSTFAPSGSSTDGPYYLATRGAAGWGVKNVVPPQSPESDTGCLPGMVAWSTELDRGVLADGFIKNSGVAGECGEDEPELVRGEPHGRQNLFVRDGETGGYQLVNVTQPGVPTADAEFQAASSDLSHVVFDSRAKLTENAPTGENREVFYEWSAGVVRLLTVLPDGAPVDGQLADRVIPQVGFTTELESPGARHSLSADGSRAVFVANGDLFVREHADREQSMVVAGACTEPAQACTVQADASQAGGSGGGGQFMGASADGSLVYFTDADTAGLTESTVPGSGQNLYRYDVETGVLTDLTAGPEAQVLGVSGMGEDGSQVYFVAEGQLTSEGKPGAPNLYMANGGTVTYIATLDPADSCDWTLSCMTARVSRNGGFIGFNSVAELTGFANNPRQEIFLYDANAAALSCASCDPTGAPPTAPASIRRPVNEFTLAPVDAHLQRYVSDTGQVFFDTFDQLPGARNGQSNVFEYENGTLHILSGGTSAFSSFFYEANATGKNVFFVTSQPLTSVGAEGEYRIVDARENGGFPTPAAPAAPCGGEECLSPAATSPASPNAGSGTYTGPGNPAPPSAAAPPKPKSAAEIRAGRLNAALRACRTKHNRHNRRVCESRARGRFGSLARRSNHDRRAR
jgi:hypothetical protein